MTTTSLHIVRLEDWPASDRQAWDSAINQSNGGFLSLNLADLECRRSSAGAAPKAKAKPKSVPASYEETTRINIVEAWGQYLGYLDDAGLLDSNAPVHQRADLNWVFGYLKELQNRGASGRTIATRATSVSMFLGACCPEANLAKLATILKVFRRSPPSVNKAGRIVDPDVLSDIGLQLMATCAVQEGTELPSKTAALAYRDGLMLCLLAQRPIRRQNFTDLSLGESFVREDNRYWIHLTADTVKTDKPIDLPCPADLTEAIDRYITVCRPVLLPAGSDCTALWISRTGLGLTAMGAYQAIRDRTVTALGISITPHLFRDCAATFLYKKDPEATWAIAGVLGHSNLATSRRYYIHAQSIDAHRLHQVLVTRLRDDQPGQSSSVPGEQNDPTDTKQIDLV